MAFEDEPQADCRRCGAKVEDLPEEKYRCGCGTYSYVCEHCGSPHSGVATVCDECFDEECAKGD